MCIIGAGGHGKSVAETASLVGYDDIFFLDDDDSLHKCGKWQVSGNTLNANKYIDTCDFIVAIGNNEVRKHASEKLRREGAFITTLVHPSATIAKGVWLSEGAVVMAGAVVGAGARIGCGAIVNTLSSVDHDCSVGNWCHIACGATVAGTVDIADGCWIGAGATISNNVRIACGVTVGAGAVVVHDIDDRGTYVGVPARRQSRSK